MQRITEEGKIKNGRGTGTGVEYKPWIKIRELNSKGTASNIIDWKNGRQIELLSQAEVWWYYVLRWDDNVIDIREQYPLVLDITLAICDECGFVHPANRKTRMTTDFLVDYCDGNRKAFSVKADRAVLDNPREVEKQFIEKEYWNKAGIPFQILYKEDLSRQFVMNIKDIVYCYDANRVADDIGKLRYLIAHKKITVDLNTKLDYQALTKLYVKRIERWSDP